MSKKDQSTEKETIKHQAPSPDVSEGAEPNEARKSFWQTDSECRAALLERGFDPDDSESSFEGMVKIHQESPELRRWLELHAIGNYDSPRPVPVLVQVPDLDKFIHETLDYTQEAQHEVNQLSQALCGIRAVSAMLECIAQPCNEINIGEDFPVGFLNDLSQLLDVMARWGLETVSTVQEKNLDHVRYSAHEFMEQRKNYRGPAA